MLQGDCYEASPRSLEATGEPDQSWKGKCASEESSVCMGARQHAQWTAPAHKSWSAAMRTEAASPLVIQIRQSP